MKPLFVFLSVISFITFTQAKEVGFTQEDRERLIKLETTMQMFMKQTDKRFEDINRRFEDINGRFEDINRRFEELRNDMNNRFEQIQNQIEQLYTFLWMITTIFATIMAVNIGFAYWDRRTIIKKAKEETIEELEERGSIRKLIETLREKAKTDPELAKILKQYNLL